MQNIFEEWKDIKGYEGLYQISNYGRVKSLPKSWIRYDGNILHQKELILKERYTKNGYARVCLSKNSKSKDFYIHRLVALHFLDNPNCFDEINHLDEDKTNNRFDNIEWCDRKYNNNYGSHTYRSAISRGKKIAQYTIDGKLINTFPSIRQADRTTKINQSLIGKCCKGIYRQGGGFIWKYI